MSADPLLAWETLKMASPVEAPKASLDVFDPTCLEGREVPPRKWVVSQWIPEGYVTGLYGDGGVGKSLAAQQLQTSCALGRPWLGLETQQMRSLALYCEDSIEELHRRQNDINRLYGCRFKDLDAVRWLPRLGFDNLFMKADRGGVKVSTDFFESFREAALEHGAKLVIVDTVADTFGGNENDRGEVRQYVQSALGLLAREIGGTVLACAHPSRTGLKTGDQDGGSTGWSNAFRSRLSLERLKEDESPDPNERELVRRKANYAARDETVALYWKEGAFTTRDRHERQRPAAETVFMSLLQKMTKQGRHVSEKLRSGNYAPTIFSKDPESERYRRADFERAMNVLFDQKAIRIGLYRSYRREVEGIEQMPPGGEPF